MKIKYTVLMLLLFTVSVFAEIKGTTTYEITKHTFSSGGGLMSGGGYTVVTSIGQIDAGHNTTGGTYEFNGGFLAGVTTNNDTIFKDSFE